MINVTFIHGPLGGVKQNLPENRYKDDKFIYCLLLPSDRHYSTTQWTGKDLMNMLEQHVYRLIQTPDGWVAVYSHNAEIKKG